MKGMIEVVVGILNKDCGPQLRNCLRSLQEQTLKRIAVVVVDGKSRDNSLQVLREFSKADPRIKYFVQRSNGTGMARNELIDYVKSHFPNTKVIVWGDAENIYPPDYLEKLLKAKAEIVGGINIIDSDSPLSQALWWYYNGFTGKTFVGNNEAVKISVYDKIRYLPITRTEDFFFQRAARKKGIKAVKVEDAVCYVKTVESITEFVKWEASRTKGLWEGSKITGYTKNLWLTYLLTSSLSFGYLIVLPILLILTNVTLLLPYMLTLVIPSAILWFKGKKFVRRMSWKTFFVFVPLSLMDSFSVLFSLIKLTYKEKRRIP